MYFKNVNHKADDWTYLMKNNHCAYYPEYEIFLKVYKIK